jgi:CcmD family protein
MPQKSLWNAKESRLLGPYLIPNIETGETNMSLTVLAIANAVLWVGLFLFLLFRLMSQRSQIEAQIDRLERTMTGGDEN